MKTRFLLPVVAIVCATGCGTSFYGTSNQNQNQTSVVLADNNFRIVKTVSAEVHCSYVFGIGGLSRKAMMSNAISELTCKAQLTGSQALVNVTTKIHNKVILVWAKRSMVAQGTVIEFIDKGTMSNQKCSEEALSSKDMQTEPHYDKELEGLSYLSDMFVNGTIDEKSKFKASLIVARFSREILDDIKNSKQEIARKKMTVLEIWYANLDNKDVAVQRYLDSIRTKLNQNAKKK